MKQGSLAQASLDKEAQMDEENNPKHRLVCSERDELFERLAMGGREV